MEFADGDFEGQCRARAATVTSECNGEIILSWHDFSAQCFSAGEPQSLKLRMVGTFPPPPSQVPARQDPRAGPAHTHTQCSVKHAHAHLRRMDAAGLCR